MMSTSQKRSREAFYTFAANGKEEERIRAPGKNIYSGLGSLLVGQGNLDYRTEMQKMLKSALSIQGRRTTSHARRGERL